MTTTTIGLINPLPRALAHYESALDNVLSQAGVQVERLSTTSVEMGSSSQSRLGTTLELLGETRYLARVDASKLLVLWPAMGYLDLLKWRISRRDVDIVFHDPAPLRRQFGLGSLSRRVGVSTRGTTGVISHSAAASEVLRSFGLTPSAELAHPMLEPVSLWRPGHRVVVAGQFKDARDLGLLASLGGAIRARGLEPVIAGRGWPPVVGWAAIKGFLEEDEFDSLLRQSACVLLPYRRLFQSGVAVRAVEQGVPVVGPRRSNLPALLGPEWPGLIEEGASVRAWVDAIAATSVTEPNGVARRATWAFQTALREWGSWANAA